MAADKQGRGRPAGDPAVLIIDDRFRISPGSQLADLGGLACFQAEDRRGLAGEVVALRANAFTPPRPKLSAFLQAQHEGMLAPLAHGVAGSAYWIICPAPPGPSLASLASPWSGNALLTHVLRPVTRVLDHLQMSGLTHRAIRPDNVFVATGSRTLMLGPAWAAPPAMHQPAVFEPPYSALCPPSARGDGSIADDVYALGVLLLALWTGEMPLAGSTAREIIQLKLEYGSHAALTGKMRLQRGFEEILRAMLSDDPLARPSPAALANLDGIHARRGSQRMALRTARPIAVGEHLAWNRPTLAVLCAEHPSEAMALLRHGTIEQWLRYTAEDAALAGGVEELRRDDTLGDPQGPSRSASRIRTGVNDLSLLRLIALLDPLAPLFWRGSWVWPDGLGPLLAGALAQPPAMDPLEAAALVEALMGRGVAGRWRLLRGGRADQAVSSLPPALLQRSDGDDDQALLLRLAYLLNPYLPCVSPRLGGELAMSVAGLMALLERLAEPGGARPLLDAHMLAFLAARLEDQALQKREPGDLHPDQATTRELLLLARCQALASCGPMVRIATSLLPGLEASMQDWPGVSRREKRVARLRALAAAGDLKAMPGLLHDPEGRRQDDAARSEAVQKLAGITAALAEQADTMPLRLEASRAAARDTASAMGILSIMAVLLFELLS
jgi:eukaryotic-like serine/threonine-protein kinase